MPKTTPPQGVQQRREAERREEKLENINRQVADGSLVIRQMTDAERAVNPKPTGERAVRGRRR